MLVYPVHYCTGNVCHVIYISAILENIVQAMRTCDTWFTCPLCGKYCAGNTHMCNVISLSTTWKVLCRQCASDLPVPVCHVESIVRAMRTCATWFTCPPCLKVLCGQCVLRYLTVHYIESIVRQCARVPRYLPVHYVESIVRAMRTCAMWCTYPT
jgi:hypothetical protein